MKINYIYILIITLFVKGTSLFAQDQIDLNPVDDFTYEEIDTKTDETTTTLIESTVQNSTETAIKASSSGIGETEGALSVSLTGGATYTVPIAVPPGIVGVEPNLALVYNSQAGNGTAGWGWNVSGASTIKRIPLTEYHDGDIDGVDFDSTDRFALDGQRLILKSGVYGTDGAEYQTEQYSNLKITSYGQSPMGASSGPAYFEVKYPDGSSALYGRTTESRSRLEYAITYRQNPQGIRISYSYSTNGNTLYLKSVKYGARNTGTPINEVNFSYTNRARAEKSYVGGYPFTRSLLLNKIQVKGNGTAYRNYELNHQQNALDYQTLTSIQEKTGDNTLAHSPINFTYQGSTSSLTHSLITSDLAVANIEQRNSSTVTLDLTGDGKMDFLVYPNTKDKFWIFKDQDYSRAYQVNSGTFEDILPSTFLNHQNKIIPGTGLTVIHHTENNKVEFKAYSEDPYSLTQLYYDYKKTWSPPTYITDLSCTNENQETIVPQEYLSGDFNGDGLTDIVAVSKKYETKSCAAVIFNCKCQTTSTNDTSRLYFIDMDRRKTSGYVTDYGPLRDSYEDGDRLVASDFNGDGKTDIIHFTSGAVYVYSLHNNSNIIQLMTTLVDSRISNDKPKLVGDYNGDGKADFIVPQTNGLETFYLFTSKGTSFTATTGSSPISFYETYSVGDTAHAYNYIPVDMDGDGKTDIVKHYAKTYNSSSGLQRVRVYHNLGNSSGSDSINFELAGDITIQGNVEHYPVPIFLPSDQPNFNFEFATISNKKVHSFRYNWDNKEATALGSISSNGVNYKINYNNLDTANNTYASEVSQIYPYVDIFTSPSTKLVSSIERQVANTPTIKQDFYYKGAVSHLTGLGFRGFRYQSRSNWHTDNSDRIYTNTTHDIELRGAVIDKYQTPYTQRFGMIPSDYIYHIKNDYERSIASNKVFKLKLTTTTDQNRLLGTANTTSYQYNTYNNISTKTINYSGHGSVVTNFSYTNSLSNSDYYIGRLASTIVTSTIDGDKFTTTEKYKYTNGLVTSVEDIGNGTASNFETFEYDAFGNIVKTTSTPNGETSRTSSAKYDSSGRFMIESTDIEGLTTSFTYNMSTGMLLTATNPFDQTTSYTYDKWNRVATITDFLGNVDKTTYTESSNQYVITNIYSDGASTETKFDQLHRKVYDSQKSLNGNWVRVSYEYDKFDRIAQQSEPHFGNAPTQWNTTLYDFYGRVSSQQLYTGKNISYSYNNLITTVNDGTKTVSTTKDAMGNVIKTDDPGGPIYFTYYGNGALESSNYRGRLQKIEQDGWGRKTKLTDPSAGEYTYTYNGYGEVIEETTPKGSTTYTYLPTGRVSQSIMKGDLTNMTTSYTYDSATKQLTTVSAVDAFNSSTYMYTYAYDSYLRPSLITENANGAIYSKALTYDTYSRLKSEMYTAQVDGITSTSDMAYSYDGFGNLIQSSDSKITTMTARGQVTKMILGDSEYVHTKSYDPYGYLQSEAVGVNGNDEYDITNDYQFNTVRGTLTSRKRTSQLSSEGLTHNYEETFSYDNLDRLTAIDGPHSETKTYEEAGRIMSNSNIGDYLYKTGDPNFQLQNITLNANGEEHFRNRAMQEITYNMFKNPVDINEPGKGRVSFAYGPMGNRVDAWYGGEESEKTERRYHKRYSTIIPAEVIQDTEDNSYKVVFYRGGDAYSAPFAKIETFKNNQSESDQLFYLQRDYLGSIENIMLKSDTSEGEQYTLVESRRFGAWGTIDSFWSKDEDNTFSYATAILDRGYTGHEHFFDIDLIHMNGRMYDPHLARFLSPDNYIQSPYNSQNYNRYSYVLNNPLMYNDPSGELLVEAGLGAYFLAGAIMGGSVLSGNWDNWGIGDFFDGLFGGGKSSEPQVIKSSQNYASADPMIAPNPGIGSIFTNDSLNWEGFARGVWDSLSFRYSGGIGTVGLEAKATKYFQFKLGAEIIKFDYYTGRDRVKLGIGNLKANFQFGEKKDGLLNLDASISAAGLRYNNVLTNLMELESPDFERFEFLKGKAFLTGGIYNERFMVGGEGTVLRNSAKNGWSAWDGRPILGFAYKDTGGVPDLFDETDIALGLKTPIGKFAVGLNFLKFEKAWHTLMNK
ncbi:FG-GAP-like repeat-containing protein [Aquimarina pacifica]|uniref:FG-GAP-like repeat-containing protein n=1 Tax=Aquimarina pacifica TaxID=1296415 RepID=UPI000472CF87|nr:FG-GAP-like repeat-containing protein [Aquimarina pacifica]